MVFHALMDDSVMVTRLVGMGNAFQEHHQIAMMNAYALMISVMNMPIDVCRHQSQIVVKMMRIVLLDRHAICVQTRAHLQ